jgi:hypothetical protein
VPRATTISEVALPVRRAAQICPSLAKVKGLQRQRQES